MDPNQSETNTTVGMTDREIQALTRCYLALLSLFSDLVGIDPMKVSTNLSTRYPRLRSLHVQISEEIRCQERQQVNVEVLTNVQRNVGLMGFINALDDCGYKTQATDVLRTFLSPNTNEVIHRSFSGQRPRLNMMANLLKTWVDNPRVKNPHLLLRHLGQKWTTFMETEQDVRKKQRLAEECVVIKGAEIDAIAITNDKNIRNNRCFKELSQLIDKTSKPFLSDGLFYGRLALAFAIANRFDKCTNMLQAARLCVAGTSSCYELVTVRNVEVHTRLVMFEKNPTKEERRSLLQWAQIGMDCADMDNSDGDLMWRMSFLRKMVFCLLGLGNRGNVIEDCSVEEADIQTAKQLLEEINRNLPNLEERRKMFYYHARARIAELRNRSQICENYTRMAIDIALKNHFHELVSLSEYLVRVWR